MPVSTTLSKSRSWWRLGKSLLTLMYIPLTRHSGMRMIYLPPYSPDLNPIEEAFSAIKAWIRNNRDYVDNELSGEPLCDPYAMFWAAVYSACTPENAEGWFRHSGYLM